MSFGEAAGATWAFHKSPVCIIWLAQEIWPGLSNTSVGWVFLVAVHLLPCIVFSSVCILLWRCK